MRRNPERIRDVNAAALIAIGSLGLTLTGYTAPSIPGDESFMLALISSAVFIGGGALYEKGTRQIMKEQSSSDQVGETASLQIEYEI
jgi:hypothetical protein